MFLPLMTPFLWTPCLAQQFPAAPGGLLRKNSRLPRPRIHSHLAKPANGTTLLVPHLSNHIFSGCVF